MNTSPSHENPAFFLGIDVGKKDLFSHIIAEKQTQSERFDNTERGVKELHSWLQTHTQKQNWTGHYGNLVVNKLFEKEYEHLYVVNPQRIKAYSQLKLRRNKSDSADARLISQYIQSEHHDLRKWTPRSDDHQEIMELNRYAESLTQDTAQLKTRTESLSNKNILRSINRRIKSQEKELKNIRKKINTIVNNNALSVQKELLESIPGVGEVTSHTLIAELPEIDQFDGGRQLAAWAGLTPCHFVSGTSGRSTTPITKVGSAHVRRNLFMPAMSARTSNPVLKEFGDRLKENGKAPKQIIVAIMRKLLHIIYGILKSGEPFNPNKRGFKTAWIRHHN